MRALDQVKRAIREPHAFPGGYPVYVIMADGALLCGNCARAEYRQIVRATKGGFRDGWKALGAQVYWEGPAIQCAHCSKPLESAYGDPEIN